MRRPAVIALSVLAVLGGLAAGTAPASAESGAVVDAEFDVARFSDTPARGRSEPLSDITSTTVQHRNRNVVAFVGLQDVEYPAAGTSTVEVKLVTPDAPFIVSVSYTQGSIDSSLESRGVVVGCGLSGTVNTEREVLRMQVPRSCLGSPETVRFGSRATLRFEGGSQVDDGGRAEPVRSPTQTIKVGARRLARD